MNHYLLLQCRLTDDPMRFHEQECVQRALDCAPEHMTVVNLSERLPTEEEIQASSAILIGGSGAFHIYDKVDWIERALVYFSGLLRRIDRPILGMCFGHQALLKASGAQVGNDPEREELGTYELEVTEEGRSDQLFGELPERFYVQLGHVDRAFDLPQGWLGLASSESQPYQAVRLSGYPVWGFQFHAELRMEDNLHRVRHYADHYGAAREEVFDQLKAKHRSSPVGAQIMRHFARIVSEYWENPTCVESPPPSVSL
jgi:GMP synthase (glutamine-hydrolysing)